MLSGYLERSLSPSCEGVLQLLWGLPEGIEFRSDPLPKTEWKRVTTTGQEPLASWFPVVREWCIDCLQDRRFPLPQRILMMGLGLQELANGEMDLCRWRERVSLLPESSGGALLPNGAKERAIVLMGCVRTLLTIQHDDVAFQGAREEIFHALDVRIQREEKKATASVSRYQQALGKYEELFQGHGYFMENLMVSVFFLLRMPSVGSREDLWKSYVNFCNLYAFFRFMAAMGCREGIEDCKAEMFKLLALTSRALLHNNTRRSALRDEFFKNDSATLAHMAILLGG